MNFVLMLGSPLRAGVIEHLRAAGLSPRLVLTPKGRRFEELARTVGAAGFDTRAVPKAEVSATLKALAPDVVLCVGWPFLFSPDVVDGPWLLLNSHPTLLPKHRGPNPWYHVIAEGHVATGVTIHKIDEGMDSGPILHQAVLAVSRFETYRSLRTRLVALEPPAIADALKKVASGKYELIPQDETAATTYLERRTPEHSQVDPTRPLAELIDHIRACDPDSFPAFFHHEGQKVCIRLWRPSRSPDESDETL